MSIAHNPPARLSTDTLRSAQISVAAMGLREKTGHEEALGLLPLEPGTGAAVAAITDGLAAFGPERGARGP